MNDSYHPEPSSFDRLKTAERGTWLSIFSYIILSLFKITTGYFFHSRALIADGLNNLTDIISSVTVLLGIRFAQKPIDDDHMYGHYKYETISSLITSIIMLFIGFQIFKDLFSNFQTTPLLHINWLTIMVPIISGIWMLTIYWYNDQLATRVQSKGLRAAAKDNLSDGLVSFATALALIGVKFGFPWLDPLMGGLVSLIIIRTSIEIFRDAVFDLTDGFQVHQIDDYEQTIFNHPLVSHVDSVKARVYGSQVYLDVTISVNPELTVRESHQITEEIEQILEKKHHISFIDIHVEPDDIPDAPQKYTKQSQHY
ncbi:cation diffusion facilitator family transporter [Atopobacter phocae]|uniref:cation diffusion facilitator family transporter n=1 Tax=Atopobacter phocae TaxID=136492 RepID=UPI00047163E3|nr:cation diffusion facilitator family transporter [Atopobacter phocae]